MDKKEAANQLPVLAQKKTEVKAPVANKQAPQAHILAATSKASAFLENAQPFIVPVDSPTPIALMIAPTASAQDIVESVTLKSFRKVVGYDTFNSILKKNRDEMKDPADHYNVTVSLMVRREPQPRTGKFAHDIYNPG